MEERIEKSYYYFLNEYGYLKDEEVNTNNRKEEYYEVLFELVDTSKDKVQCLTEDQTKLLREFVGLTKEVPTLTELAKEYNVSISTIKKRLHNTARNLYRRIIRGCISLEEAIRTGSITKSDLLNTPLYVADYSDEQSVTKILRSRGFQLTLEDVINLGTDAISKTYSLNKRGLDGFVDYIHSLGLTFKDEVPSFKEIDYKDEDKYENINSFNNNMRIKEEFSDAYNSLLSKLNKLEEEEALCDEIIEEQIKKKQEILEKRKELAKVANQIIELSNDKPRFGR